MSRSAHWQAVRNLVERSRRRSTAFDPAEGDPVVPVREGITPIVSLYVHAQADGDGLTDVERSLLSGALNDWLQLYAECRDTHCEGSFTVHEVATAYARDRDIETTLSRLVVDR
jgi:hypothetical protein